MREQDFVAQFAPSWTRLEDFLAKRSAADGLRPADFPEAYRQLCNQLAQARAHGFSWALVDRLNTLAAEGRSQLYRGGSSMAVADFFLRRLPCAVRREKRWIWAGFLIFLLGMALGAVSVPLKWGWMEAWGVNKQMDELYEPSRHQLQSNERKGAEDVFMWGFYINHNTAISLRTIAGGALAGVGTAVSDAFNGVNLGIAISYTVEKGWAAETLLPFAATHSAFELTALFLAAGAGFALAAALFFPGRRSRADSVRHFTERFFPILVCVILFDFIAAGLEAFFSPRSFDPALKYAAGAVMWCAVYSYFALCGRRFDDAGA